MLKKLIDVLLKERLIVYFSVGLIVIAGIYAYTQLPIEAYPDLTNTRVQIITQWKGKSAEEIEKFLTIPIETEMNSVPKLISLRSVSLFGLSQVTLTFDDNADDFFARTKINEKLRNIELPDGVKPTLSAESAPTGEIFRYILKGEGLSPMDLKTTEDWVLERHLKNVPGVADVVSFGGPTKQYEISVNPHKLQNYNLTLSQVIGAVSQNNSNAGGSLVEQGQQAFVFRGLGMFQSLDDIKNVVVNSVNGIPITVGQVAEVKIGNAVRLGYVGNKDSKDAVEGIILMRKGENPSDVLEGIRKKVDELNNKILPKNIKIEPYYDRGDLVKITTHTVLHNLLMGIILVLIILFIFLGNARSALIAATIIPLSLLFAFIFMWMKGMSANLLSLGAIDFGVIIDGAVIMVEVIFAKLAHGEITDERERMAVIKETSMEMTRPIFFSVVIIICAMIPIFSFQKIEGRMFSPLAFTLGFSLIGALIFSLTYVPAISMDLLKGRLKENNYLLSKIQKYYKKILDFCLEHDKKVLAVSIILVVISLYVSQFLGTEFLPTLNEGNLWIRATLPMSISLSAADSTTSNIRKYLSDYKEVKNVISQLGRPDDGTDAAGPYNAEFFVDLKPEDEWVNFKNKNDLINDMNRKFNEYPGVDLNFSQYISDNVQEAVLGIKGALAVKIFGEDLNVLEEKASNIRDALEKVEGITDVGIFSEIGQPVLQAKIDRQKIARYGINVSDVQDVIESSIGGKTITQFYEGEKNFDVVVRYDENFRNSMNKIGELLVASNSGIKVPLSELAVITYEPGASYIYRENNARFIAIKFSVRERDLGGAVKEAQEKVEQKVKLPAGYYTTWGGEFENQQRALTRLAVVVPLSLLIITMLLYLAFDSWGYTLLILSSVPFTLVGGIFSLLIANLHFSVSAGIGFIALFGVSVQDGVVLLSYIKRNKPLYENKMDLIKKAASERIRPILMVALLAIFGLTPAALSQGIGSETQKPLAIVIVGGLLAATALNLLILPVMYKLFTPKK